MMEAKAPMRIVMPSALAKGKDKSPVPKITDRIPTSRMNFHPRTTRRRYRAANVFNIPTIRIHIPMR